MSPLIVSGVFISLLSNAIYQCSNPRSTLCCVRSEGIVVVVYFILSRLLYLAFSANLGLLCMPHPGMGPLV